MLPIDALNAVRYGNCPATVSSIGFSPSLRLLVLAPHPDDFDAIAVTLRYFYLHGNDIHVAVLSGGSKGVQDSGANPLTWERKARLREQEQSDSCSYFGLPTARLSFLRLPEARDGELDQDTGNQTRVKQQILETSPDVLLLPYGDDSNSGHRRTFDMARIAVRDLGKPLLALYNRDVKTLNFSTALYTGYDETQASWKRTLLRFHDSQHQRNIETRGYGFDDRILDFNRKLARDLGLEVPYAEAFQIELFHADHL